MPLLFAVLALLRGAVYAAAIPPWQSPDEHGHYEYAWLVSQHGPLAGPEAISPAFQRRVLESMAHFDWWRLAHQPVPDQVPAGFRDPGAGLTLTQSLPQVGDERPLYYLLVGGLLRLAGSPDLLVGMYIGRAVSVVLLAAAVGLSAAVTRVLFPRSLFMQVVPPVLLLSLPMLGQMGASVNSDAMGVLTGTLFFASLVPVFRGGLTWKRGGGVAGALVLALLSKKTTLFLIPTVLLALPVYGWTQGGQPSRRIRWALAGGLTLLAVVGLALGLTPGPNAAGWLPRGEHCGPTRAAGNAREGEAALRVGPCTNGSVAQTLSPEATAQVAGQTLTLSGWVRSAADPATASVTIADNAAHSEVRVAAGSAWQPVTVAHTVNANARWVTVRLACGETCDALLFDELALSDDQGRSLLINGSAEQQESLLPLLLGTAASRVGAPRRAVQLLLLPQSWGRDAWREYGRAAAFCFRSFWGNFGWLMQPLPSTGYRLIGAICLLALAGNMFFLLRRPRRSGQSGYLLVLLGGLFLLALQTLLPMVGMRGTYWLPQGRYLFPGLLAIAVILAWGAGQLLPQRWERGGALLATALLVGFDWLCLCLIILPYFWWQTR
jgi:hypothetical protein